MASPPWPFTTHDGLRVFNVRERLAACPAERAGSTGYAYLAPSQSLKGQYLKGKIVTRFNATQGTMSGQRPLQLRRREEIRRVD